MCTSPPKKAAKRVCIIESENEDDDEDEDYSDKTQNLDSSENCNY